MICPCPVPFPFFILCSVPSSSVRLLHPGRPSCVPGRTSRLKLAGSTATAFSFQLIEPQIDKCPSPFVHTPILNASTWYYDMRVGGNDAMGPSRRENMTAARTQARRLQNFVLLTYNIYKVCDYVKYIILKLSRWCLRCNNVVQGGASSLYDTVPTYICPRVVPAHVCSCALPIRLSCRGSRACQ